LLPCFFNIVQEKEDAHDSDSTRIAPAPPRLRAMRRDVRLRQRRTRRRLLVQ